MKHLIDYIEECGEGCSTPGNTMGMGNPMSPTEEVPGSEPLCAKCKKEKKKKKVTESILDADENQKNFDKNVMTAWLKKVIGETFVDRYVTVSDDGEVTSQKRILIELEDGETIPEWIKCNVDNISIDSDTDIIIPKNFIACKMDNFEINCFGGKKIIFEGNNLDAEHCTIRGSVTDVIFPKNFKCNDLNISECRALIKVENINHTKMINFPLIFCANLIKQSTKFKGELKINGFSI